MSTPTPFSYAQAAKGSAPAASVPTANGTASPAESKTNEPIVDSNDINTKVGIEATIESINSNTAASVSGSTSSSANDATTCSTASIRDEDEQTTDALTRRSEAGPRAGSASRRQEPKKARQDKKNKESSADVAFVAEPKPDVSKAELYEAPVPPVNIWQQRLKASTVKPTPAAEQQRPTEQGVKSKAANGAAPTTKTIEGAESETGSRKSRGGRSFERELASKDVEQIISDPVNWPTPETSMKEKASSTKTVEKPTETAEKDSQEDTTTASGKAKQLGKKVWEKVEFTPTARFETQMPSTRGARAPRGGARGGREGSSRGHANPSKDGEKSSSGTPHGAKAGDNKERTRDANVPRNNSLPPKKFSDTAPKEQRKNASGSVASQAGSAQSPVRDTSVAPATESSFTPRERTETRGERTRGGNRGRGGYHGSNGPAPINTQQPYTNGFVSNSTSRQSIVSPSRQSSYTGNSYNTQPRNHGRGGRNHSISMRNGPRMSGQNSNFNHDYNMQGMAPTYPVMNYYDPNQAYWTLNSLSQQISYYFSVNNLCKDVFLRKHMDSQGFVPIQVISNFKRITDITVTMEADPLELFREACAQLAVPGPDGTALIEFVVGDDNVERLRCSSGWDKWVLDVSERAEPYRNNGPASFTPHPRIGMNAYMNQFVPMYPMVSPTVPNGTSQFQGYPQQHSYRNSTPVYNNGYNYPNAGNNVYAPSFNTSQLSAAVPEFSPLAASFPPTEQAAAATDEPTATEANASVSE
ncbi:putative HTH La-type RNA-binding protein [Ceratocystis fimbriata CBS 114723]|uniref:Putative HTH La-type RNA-binding protein n=1 Tax=Ceratocystis fimbriata CBS 114723 TaxID=1035309 RepID=A0A2C5X3T3_9PEZI|nr:putative HTH La-type RNA-binding protein [Ceratocystis fimbriata CBS 114723]